MLLDLNHLPYNVAFDIIKWCWDNNIDRIKCIQITNSIYINPTPDINWTLNIPNKHITFLLLKFSDELTNVEPYYISNNI